MKNLTVIEANVEEETFVARNREGQETSGAIGDLIGLERFSVVEVRNTFLMLETREVVEMNSYNKEIVKRMRIPVARAMNGKGVQ